MSLKSLNNPDEPKESRGSRASTQDPLAISLPGLGVGGGGTVDKHL